jgi:hypothetical protein
MVPLVLTGLCFPAPVEQQPGSLDRLYMLIYIMKPPGAEVIALITSMCSRQQRTYIKLSCIVFL